MVDHAAKIIHDQIFSDGAKPLPHVEFGVSTEGKIIND
jgi:hypothetical protein